MEYYQYSSDENVPVGYGYIVKKRWEIFGGNLLQYSPAARRQFEQGPSTVASENNATVIATRKIGELQLNYSKDITKYYYLLALKSTRQ